MGKTWALREFAKREYAKEAYIICRKNELVEQVFKQDFNAACALVLGQIKAYAEQAEKCPLLRVISRI